MRIIKKLSLITVLTATLLSASAFNSLAATIVPNDIQNTTTEIRDKAENSVGANSSNSTSANYSIELNKSEITLGTNEKYKLVVKTNCKNLSFTSSNVKVAKVSSLGEISPTGTGKTTITCKANGKQAKCNVTVKPQAKSLKLNASKLNLVVGQTYDFNSYVNSGSAAYFRSYSSNNGYVLSIEKGTGVAKANRVGIATITCLLQNGIRATCLVSVTDKPNNAIYNNDSNITPAKINTNHNVVPETIKIGIGETFDSSMCFSSGSSNKYYSENKSIVSINEDNGRCKGNKTGKTRIYCQKDNERVYKDVVVYSAPKSISINTSNSTKKVGDTFTITENTNKGSYANAFNLDWSSSNSKCVRLISRKNNKAQFQVMSLGSTYLTVKTFNNKTAKCKITVNGSKVKCIDVSFWNTENIDYNKVRKSGINYVIMRAGFRNTKDKYFETNYKNAKKAGMKIGVYWYMYATDIESSKREAESCLKALKGKKIDMPVYYDVEEEDSIIYFSQAKLTNMSVAFCSTIKKAGLKAGVYSSTSVFSHNYKLNRDTLVKNGFSIWNAQWASHCSVNCDVWQYSSEGHINGVPTVVDLNLIYNLNICS